MEDYHGARLRDNDFLYHNLHIDISGAANPVNPEPGAGDPLHNFHHLVLRTAVNPPIGLRVLRVPENKACVFRPMCSSTIYSRFLYLKKPLHISPRHVYIKGHQHDFKTTLLIKVCTDSHLHF